MLLGDYRFEIVPDTEFWLDGGAMFGVIPRVLWEKVAPADDKNRIRMNMNCAFIDTGRDKILIETGIGEKWTDKQTKMYGIARERQFADSLFAITGCRPDDITIVVNTHLHFDHAGGNSISFGRRSSTGVAVEERELNVPQFPNARYLVSRSELAHAESPHERDRASYLPENWHPMQQTGQLEQMPDDYEVVPGLRLQTVRGHSETMQTWRLDRGGETVYGFADLIPMKYHVALPWIAGFDLYPTETLAFKKDILPRAVHENWMCLFYHDVESPLMRLIEDNNRIRAIEVN
jgi:glyoxylase-like metal-dependent hydrolase (beta-lactamase superfamily II)